LLTHRIRPQILFSLCSRIPGLAFWLFSVVVGFSLLVFFGFAAGKGSPGPFLGSAVFIAAGFFWPQPAAGMYPNMLIFNSYYNPEFNLTASNAGGGRSGACLYRHRPGGHPTVVLAILYFVNLFSHLCR